MQWFLKPSLCTFYNVIEAMKIVFKVTYQLPNFCTFVYLTNCTLWHFHHEYGNLFFFFKKWHEKTLIIYIFALTFAITINKLLIIIEVYYRDRHSAIWVRRYFSKESLTMPVFPMANEFCNFIASTTATSWPSNTWKWLANEFINNKKHLQRLLKSDFERTLSVSGLHSFGVEGVSERYKLWAQIY